MAEIINLTDQSFKELVFDWEKSSEWKYEGNVPAIVDFWASWCAPCRAVAPVLEDLQKEYGDKIQIYKLNTEENQIVPQSFGINSIPSLLFVPVDGQPQMATGALPKSQFKTIIKDVFGL